MITTYCYGLVSFTSLAFYYGFKLPVNVIRTLIHVLKITTYLVHLRLCYLYFNFHVLEIKKNLLRMEISKLHN
jgi:hypothetical protein